MVGVRLTHHHLIQIMCLLYYVQPITLDQMIHHCQAVKRGAPNRPLLVGDMPFGSYEFENVDVALQNAYRMVKEGGMDAVKFEVSVGLSILIVFLLHDLFWFTLCLTCYISTFYCM